VVNGEESGKMWFFTDGGIQPANPCMTKFDELIGETRREIRILLRNPDVRPAFMTYDQLRDVQSEICRMARVRDPEKFFPYYPKGMADEATKIYSDREGAAYELWLLVKIFTQTEPLWSKYKPVYNGFWLTKHADKLEKYR